MTLTLEVEDSKVNSFVEMLKSFDYVKLKRKSMSAEKKRILDALERSVEDVKKHKKGEIELQSWDELLEELKQEKYL
jgi:hypothetical protein